MNYAIKVKNVSKEFVDKNKLMPQWLLRNSEKNKFFAVKDANFDVKKQEVFGILGPNGCGKSTLIRMISTLLVPDTGSIEVFGVDAIKNPDKVKKMINRVSVEASFFKRLSARENLLYASRLYGIDDKVAIKKFMQILQELGFSDKKTDDPMYKFSRGMQQKVSIARGFLTNPRLALLDEPTTGLDPKSKIDVQKFLKKTYSEKDLTIVITSHDMNEVEKLCDRIAIMDKGKIIALGTSEELKEQVMDREVYEIDTSNKKQTFEIVNSIKGVHNVHKENGKLRFSTKNLKKSTDFITSKLAENGITLKSFNKVVPTLEDVFLELTGKLLEDEE